MRLETTDHGLRRVCIHAGAVAADVCVPAAVPVATLIPALVDLLGDQCGQPPRSYHLAPLGAASLPVSTTLAQNDIRDGAVLVLSHEVSRPPTPRNDDLAETVSTTLVHKDIRTATRLGAAVTAGVTTAVAAVIVVLHGPAVQSVGVTAAVAATTAVIVLSLAGVAQRTYRESLAAQTLALIAVVNAAVAGFVAVPGPPSLLNVLPAATSAAVAARLAARLMRCDTTIFRAVTVFAAVTALSALTGVLTEARPPTVGVLGALGSLAALELSPRIALVAARLSPADDQTLAEAVTEKVVRADRWLTCLSAAFCASAAAGAAVAALSTPRGLTLSGITGALFLLQTRNRRQSLVFAVTGTVTAAATCALAAMRVPHHSPWIAASAAVLSALAMYLGFVGPGIPLSPLARRSIDALECLALIAVVPVSCWVSGAFDTVRALHLG
ncbi:type VII secretion integral membrane protein EccD [Mycobacterium sp. 1423905.2]|uniref:type VII secretion integral membrane protein EccD n=1 Tax=Mycobacterium sp. 1423905.2 TaxID=1856859 RepID=UPI0008013915|nr:type VII secretion integral membrane protein EccD [Mycobacterium sp. 1423905.2]OBJ49533.1 type VII secretion integral membrane protein EccD [Mycobacterium sp. 1423905.2]